MSLPTAARLALWWVDRYTATAPPDVREDRRAEVRSDVHDELAARTPAGTSEPLGALPVLARAVRGVPADVRWRMSLELTPTRLGWHVRHPASLLATLLVLLVPLGLLIDASRRRVPWLDLAAEAAAGPVLLASAVAVGVGSVAALRWCAAPRRAGLVGARRATHAALAVAWALSGLWRFVPGGLGALSTAGWVGVGVCLPAYAVLWITTGARRLLDLGKVPS
jgi:hypothetical protein